MRFVEQRFMAISLIVVCLACILGTGASAAGQRASATKPGCPFKALTAKVQAIFGPYDRAMTNSGEIEGAEIPSVAKVRETTMYTCTFQRASTREVLQIIANVYPSTTEATSAFTEASKVKNAGGPFYTSSRQVGKMQVFEGPGRSLSVVDTEVVILHWQTVQGAKLLPVDKPGSTLTPIAQVWFGPLLK